MRFKPAIAPQKCVVLSISNGDELYTVLDEIAADLMDGDLATRVDKSTASLGRKYSRADEVGVPYAVTVDFDTLTNGTVTLRERDSTVQIRLPKSDVFRVVFDFVHGRLTWVDATAKYPIVTVKEDEE
jgi:glycyl-tRNA synthetase